MNKKCYRCGSEKPQSLFSRGQDWCKKCASEYARALWRDNESHRRRINERKRRIIKENESIIRAAKSVPCADCGGSFPHYIMDLHHVGPKRAVIGRLVCCKKEVVVNEIRNCIVLCANCHRARTYGG